MLAGTTVGIAIWGPLEFFTVLRAAIPHGGLAPAPADAEIENASSWPRAAWLVLGVPATIALAWLADRWRLGGVFVPGQFTGAALAHLLAAVLTSRWQRAHDRQVLTGTHGDGDPVLYTRPAT